MYQALLTRRYLTSKVMPLLAAIAVMLCVAMELIVWSVMGGFLVMLVDSGRTLIGDVAIVSSSSGVTYYEDLSKRLEADPLVAAASPTIEAYGMISLPGGGPADQVMIKGVDGPSFDRVTKYGESLWWKPLEKPLPKDRDGADPRVQPKNQQEFAQFYKEGAALTASAAHAGLAGEGAPALVVGTEVGGFNARTDAGYLEPFTLGKSDTPFLLQNSATISVWPMGDRGRPIGQPVSRAFPIVNQFRSGIYEIDSGTILLRLDALQKLLRMDAAEIRPEPRLVIDPATGEESFQVPAAAAPITDPARVNNILVRAAPGIDAPTLQARVREIYEQFAADHAGAVRPPPPLGSARVITWRDRNKTLIDAVENETSLVMFIFGIISLTSVFLVLAIFWAMVSEKTKDIGILRAIGASRGGVAWIWLRYGLAIGVVGALLGGLAAFLIVTNINPIHEWLGRNLGIVIWNPRVYYFTEIPHKVELTKAAIIMTSGIVASVAGALVPALKAAYMDPVKALRFE